jgi:hypothetical protein
MKQVLELRHLEQKLLQAWLQIKEERETLERKLSQGLPALMVRPETKIKFRGFGRRTVNTGGMR